MKTVSSKLKNITEEAVELMEKIIRWRQMKIRELIDTKYEKHIESTISPLEEIAAHIDEPVKKVEEVLKTYSINPEMSNDKIIEALNLVNLTDQEKARLEQKKNLKKQQELTAHQRLKK